ncbi:alpha/beta hydrolase [Dysgonomonas sp. Marseille-P4677]|uniref:alpha/beta hydrolase n=1 Tax=Dysgonomonas sp. Marseille-P4677 TaxID=2364790 RepID=UPI001912AC3B|nr:alpha/beta hydrolase [Dysgonomonas sp. Marseille-P4677]MBK5722454.1 alpha/beta hydrolase [Dysgonomonas sp. Marseille-P4677]
MRNYVLIVLMFLSLNCFGQEYSQSWKDLDYAGDSAIYHRLDIYLPKVEKKSYPVVIYIYGSAWFSNNGKGADLNTIGKALLDAGFAVAMPNHRSSIDAKFPAPVNDIKAAIRFVRANASTYRLDTTFVGISGSSSGGNMAAIAGTSQFEKQYTYGDITVDIEGNVGPYTKFSSAVDGVVDWFGPTNMLLMDSCGGTDFSHNDAKSPASVYIGGPIQENKDKCLLASPTTYIDPTDPPFLIFHGDKDRVVPHCQSELLHEALQKVGVPSRFYLVKDGQHGPGVHVSENLKLMVDFFISSKEKKVLDTDCIGD